MRARTFANRGGDVIEHIVLFKLKVEIEVERVTAELASGLASLHSVEVVKADLDIYRDARSYDFVLRVKFRNRAALEIFMSDSAHLAAASGVVAETVSSPIVDVES
jgi:DNA-binding Lrp family transcriptional regulator